MFLISVGLGYISAIVQLHFQHSSRDGSPLPGPKETIKVFHGETGPLVSTLHRLIEAPPDGFKGGPNGTMSKAFFKQGFRARTMQEDREGERQAVLAWIKAGAPRKPYDEDEFPIPAGKKQEPITANYKTETAWKVKSILTDRCTYCHQRADGDPKASAFPLECYEDLDKYARVSRGFMSIEKLSQTTHAHLLSFSVLYGLTGLIFAFTSYPGFLRVLIAPLPLLAQVADISCWWLARLEGPIGEQFAQAILVTGGIVGLSLVLQIVLSLFNMFGWAGKFLIVLLFVVAGTGGYAAYKHVIGPELKAEQEKTEQLLKEKESPKEKPPEKDEK